MNKLTLLYILLAIAICTASFFILRQTTSPIQTKPKIAINSYAIDATYTEYNQQGLIKTQLQAQKITEYSPKGNSIFEKPFIIAYTANRTPWYIHADQGESDKTGEKIILNGHVNIHELPTKNNPETTIKTSEFIILPKLSRAETNDPVILSRPGITIYGKGLIANLKTGQYELKSESKAIYIPRN